MLEEYDVVLDSITLCYRTIVLCRDYAVLEEYGVVLCRDDVVL